MSNVIEFKSHVEALTHFIKTGNEKLVQQHKKLHPSFRWEGGMEKFYEEKAFSYCIKTIVSSIFTGLGALGTTGMITLMLRSIKLVGMKGSAISYGILAITCLFGTILGCKNTWKAMIAFVRLHDIYEIFENYLGITYEAGKESQTFDMNAKELKEGIEWLKENPLPMTPRLSCVYTNLECECVHTLILELERHIEFEKKHTWVHSYKRYLNDEYYPPLVTALSTLLVEYVIQKDKKLDNEAKQEIRKKLIDSTFQVHRYFTFLYLVNPSTPDTLTADEITDILNKKIAKKITTREQREQLIPLAKDLLDKASKILPSSYS